MRGRLVGDHVWEITSFASTNLIISELFTCSINLCDSTRLRAGRDRPVPGPEDAGSLELPDQDGETRGEPSGAFAREGRRDPQEQHARPREVRRAPLLTRFLLLYTTLAPSRSSSHHQIAVK